jgi:hypothetical protein
MSLPEDSAKSRREPGSFPIAIVVAVVLAAAGILAGWLLIRRGPPPQQPPVLTPEARAYVHAGYLNLSDVNMSAKENFAQQRLVEITGRITNNGNRALKLVEITCVFRDPLGRVVLRERVPIVKARASGLKPGQTRDFRLPFDTIPESWNQVLPELVIAQITFE